LDFDGLLVFGMAMTAAATEPSDAALAPVPRAVLSERGLNGFCALLGLTALVLTLGVGVRDASQGLAHPATFGILAVLLVYTHVRPTRLMHRYGGVDSGYLDEALFVPMVLMLDSAEIAVAAAVASLAGNVAARRAPVKMVFNVAQTVLASLAGYGVAHAGGAGNNAPLTASVIVAACLAGATFAFVSSFAVAAIVRLASGHPLLKGLAEQWRARGVASLGALLLGVVGGIAVYNRPIAVVPAIALGWTVERAYVAIIVQRQARLAAEALQNAVVGIRNCAEPEEVKRQLLDAAASVLHGRTAAFVPHGAPEGYGALVAPLDDETDLRVAERIGGGAWLPSERQALSTLATVGGDTLRNAQLLAQLTAITEGQGEGVVAIDTGGVIRFANPAARRLLGHPDALIGLRAEEMMAIDLSSGRLDLDQLASQGETLRDDDAVLRAGGTSTPMAITVAGLPAPQTGVVMVLHDIAERKAFEGRLSYLAFHDPLTDLPNRRLFEDRLDHALARAQRQDAVHALLMVDLDRFKLVNDSYGHPAGDALLIEVAELLRDTVRSADTCARVGGDEFALLIEDIPNIHEATSLADRILERLAEGSLIDGKQVFVSASIGVAATDQAPTREALVAAADAAAYDAKSSGKGRWHLHSPSASENPRQRLELETSLRYALDHDQFELHYQPLVDTHSGALVGAEALVRWNRAEGLMRPDHFIPLAEETGLIVPLGAWVLREACRQAYEWTTTRPNRAPLKVSVNLSAQQLNRREIVREVADVLASSHLDPAQLCLEVTETVAMNDTDVTIATLAELKGLGVQVAIDDFGTGYSSLAYLKRFPLDVVKIDQTFTAGLGEDAVDSEIVAAVVRLAAARGISVIAEGVENHRQRGILADLGCPLIQGYLIAEPLDAGEFEAFWTRETPPPELAVVPA
jgi:diguanylate cyclase (GGDEF)-like protein/PAS domain S-box-containing protein